MQYLPALAEAGIEVEVAPFFDDDYLRRFYAKQSTSGSVVRAFGRRVMQLRSIKRFDLVWLEKEALPWLPWPIERALLERDVPIVSDYDDAIFHRYDVHPSGPVRKILGHKIDHVMEASALVIAGNRYLAERAKSAGAKQVVVIPTVVETNAYGVPARASGHAPSVIGWIGTPGTWAAYVEPLLPTLTASASANGAILRAVGAGRAAFPHQQLEVLEWSEDLEIGQIQAMDVGIMPLSDDPWSKGKCGYKLIQYMACGLPVVASPVGVNSEIVEHGVNGFLAATEAEWRQALATLLGDADLRRRMGEEGRRKVEEQYSLQAHAPQVANLLREAARQGARHR